MELQRTPLYDLHVSLGAKMVPFAGYEMPVHYGPGILKEHLHARAACGLFDVSHMGQIRLGGADAALAIERLVPTDILGLAEGRQRYGFFTSDTGGILDDLMIANRGDHLLLVVNAARKDGDFAHLQVGIGGAGIEMLRHRSLLALQGPLAEAALERVLPGVGAMRFMDHRIFGDIWVSRSGYTGMDGFEISVPSLQVESLARQLLEDDAVMPVGLGARDSLRLEAALCLYGHDLNETITPVEAGLTWAIPKVRRPGGARAGGFFGDTVIFREMEQGPFGRRVGLLPEGRAPMREETLLFANETSSEAIGHVTSGGFSPTLERPIAMGYVSQGSTEIGTLLYGEVRGKRLPVAVADMPFVPHTFKR